MENAITVSVTPFQAILNLVFLTWIFIIFPIIVIRKLNHLTAMIQDQFYSDKESA